jgi:hypothetical protein
MPSMTHEALLALLTERPEVLLRLIAPSVPPAWTVGTTAVAERADFAELRVGTLHADRLFTLRAPSGEVVAVVVLELLWSRAPRGKKLTMLRYEVLAHARFAGAPAFGVVLAPRARVARAFRAQRTGLEPRVQYAPLVLGPEAVPVVTDVEVARQCPELAVLSAVAHAGTGAGAAVARVALASCAALDPEDAAIYADLVLSSLPRLVRAGLEAWMESLKGKYRFQSELARHWIGVGREVGVEEGREEGRRLALASTLVKLLTLRFGPVDGTLRERIDLADVATLERWTEQVLSAASAADVLA